MRNAAQAAVARLAETDDRIVFLGSDLGPEVLPEFRNRFPKRYLMEGISEQHIVGMAAGLAMDGYRPFITTFSTFLSRRALEQIEIDVCLHNLPVRFLAFGGGMSHAALGPTHYATDDLALLRALPNLTVVAPADANEATELVNDSQNIEGPVYFRLARGGDDPIIRSGVKLGKSIALKPAGRVAIVSTGVMTQRAMKAAEILETRGISAGVLHCATVKPLDVEALTNFCGDSEVVLTLEEHLRSGGLGTAVLEAINETSTPRRILRIGLPDEFITGYGSQEFLISKYKLDPQDVVETVLKAMKQRQTIQ